MSTTKEKTRTPSIEDLLQHVKETKNYDITGEAMGTEQKARAQYPVITGQ